jgi:mRNA-degrading endonuclease toxin of MazEF toxin-antitoxin module
VLRAVALGKQSRSRPFMLRRSSREIVDGPRPFVLRQEPRANDTPPTVAEAALTRRPRDGGPTSARVAHFSRRLTPCDAVGRVFCGVLGAGLALCRSMSRCRLSRPVGSLGLRGGRGR